MDLRDYWRIVVRRRWWVIGTTAAAMALGVVMNTVTTPVYRATARIQISRPPARSILTGEVIDNPSAASENLAMYTAAELITNRKLMARAVDSLRAQNVITLDPPSGGPLAALRGLFGGSGAMANSTSVTPDQTSAQVDALLAQISVEPVRDTRLVNIHAEYSNPKQAEVVANTVADLFVQYEQDQRNAGSTSTVAYLTQQIKDVRQSMQQAEQVSAYLTARTNRLGVQDRLEHMKAVANGDGTDLQHLPIHTDKLDALERQLIDSETELAKARQIYKDRHPKLVLLESENQSIRASIRSELGSSLASLQSEYDAAMTTERSLYPGHGVDTSQPQTMVESDLANSKELYQALLTKLKEAEMGSESAGAMVEVVEPAAANPIPIRPRKMLNLLVCLMAGVTVGTGLAFLREYLRRTIRTPQDVEDHLQLPILGLIPKA